MEKIKIAYKELKNRNPIIFSTDTINGIGCIYDDCECIEKIYKMKNRKKEKPLILFFNSKNMIKHYIEINKSIEYYIEKYMPGALTIIAKPKKGLNKYLLKDDYTAFRIPDNRELSDLIDYIKKPLATTSLNISGQNIIVSREDAEKYFPDCYIYSYLKKGNKPSTIIKINHSINIIRQGKLTLED